MKGMLTRALVLFTLLVLAPAAQAQAPNGQALREQATLAFREGRYEEARRLLDQAATHAPDEAETHYLLARLYTETPLRDPAAADRALDRALALEPQNLQFLVARLQQLRSESSNFFAERIKELKRIELSNKILALDPQNPYAHEELGISYIHDFWRYRNALTLPAMHRRSYAGSDYEMGFNPAEDAVHSTGPIYAEGGIQQGRGPLQGGPGLDPSEVFLADQFDLSTLEDMGVPVQDLSRRAQRAYETAIGHLNQALAADPRRRSVYDKLMEIYALKGEHAAALEMLQQMYTFFPEDPGLWTYLGLAHHRLGNLDAAAKSFETAFRFMPEEVRQAYQDLSLFLTPEERQRYEEDPVAYAARFWTSKDPRYLTPYNERKLEHYARLTYADLLYAAPDLKLRGWETQRGRILVRYGVPQADVVIVPNRASMNDRRMLLGSLHSTVTTGERDEGSAVSVLSNRPSVEALRETPFDLVAEMNTFNIWDYGDFKFVFEDPFRNGAYRLFSPSAKDIGQGADPWLNDYEILARETFRKTPERYEFEAPGRQIEMPYLVNLFKGEDGKADLYVHYGIPILEYDPAQPMIELTANTGTFLIGAARDLLVERRRTVYGLRTDQIVRFTETNLWVDTQQMEAPPGEAEVSVEFETASGATMGVQRRKVEVPDFAADRLALSDMLLAYHIEEAPDGKPRTQADLVRRGLSITPAPWSVFGSERPIYLYFETYNLARDDAGATSYEVEILLTPKQDAKGVAKLFKGLFGREEGVSVRYSGTGDAPDEGQYQILDARDSAPGLYTLVLRVRDNVAKRTVETRKDLFLE